MIAQYHTVTVRDVCIIYVVPCVCLFFLVYLNLSVRIVCVVCVVAHQNDDRVHIRHFHAMPQLYSGTMVQGVHVCT